MNNEALRIFKIFYLLEMLKYEIEFIDKTKINRSIWDKLNAIRNQSNMLKLDIKRQTPEFNEIFEDLSNEKIFAMISVFYKMILLTEQQALEFEESLEVMEIN
jgi:hypothetical protein